jgi:hypothetical protein
MASPRLDDLIANNNKYISKIGKQINPQESKTIEEEKQLNITTPSNTETEKSITITKKDTTFIDKEINEASIPLSKKDIPVTNLIHNLINNSLNTVVNSQLRNLLFLPKVDFTTNPKRESFQKEIVDNVPKTITYNNNGYNLKLNTNEEYLTKIDEDASIVNSRLTDENLLEKEKNDIKPKIEEKNNIAGQSKETGKIADINKIDIKPKIEEKNSIVGQSKETGKIADVNKIDIKPKIEEKNKQENQIDKEIEAEIAKEVIYKKVIGIDEEIKKSINDPNFIDYEKINEKKKEFSKLNNIKEPNSDTKLTTYNNADSYTISDKNKNLDKIDPNLITSIKKLQDELDKKDKSKRSTSDLEKEANDKFSKVKEPNVNDKVFNSGTLSYNDKLKAANKIDPDLKSKIAKEEPVKISYKNGAETINFSSFKKEENFRNLYNVKETDNQFDSLRASRPGELGFLYVRPVTVNSSTYPPIKIPFEFNPKITESGLQAKYNAISFLSRIGDIQNFIGVSPLTLSFSTEYEVLADSSAVVGYRDYWVDYFTEEIIEKIEMAYRSLIMPNFIQENNRVTYIKPPVIKILFGDYEKIKDGDDLVLDYNKGQYEYSYPNDKGRIYEKNLLLASQKGIGMRFHKMFVATNLTIVKDEEKRIIYTKNGIHKYSGFSVDMTLVEVTENYMDIIPDYKVYYESFKGFNMPANPKATR